MFFKIISPHIKSMLCTALRTPDAFVFVSWSFEPSRLTNASRMASRLRQTACMDSARAAYLVFERLQSISTFSTSSSLPISFLLRFELLLKKTNICSKTSNTLATNDDSLQPCSMTRLTP